ncbi:isoaspartyl peptidase/L-asparaginase [Nitrospirillum sp. BR 11163]|uniref:isoaspartyl peptidase/L-asparaginase family protein n=1 Tax=Nitrospirillum sp. BR 11163 TaxID=3104323 RepID=UPI002B0003D1|nr:isoaspartyl peptidase/L-asparaginase [Nitrospirillum sp. BR 11163]MEA1674057.1 isoaspartyl peptidase/L-asparaginase [Nitrospirillum sp. BR 11163]
MATTGARMLVGVALAWTLLGGAAMAAEKAHPWALELHGGAGTVDPAKLTPEAAAAYQAGMTAALEAGTAVLKSGGAAVDAVEAAVKVLEDDPLFNAGRGAVFTAAGRNEMDAAIMDGATLKAGSVATVTHTRHPVSLARAVMEKTPHVMLAGEGADAFSKEAGLEQADPAWFFTERRWQALVKELTDKGVPVPPRPAGAPPEPDKHTLLDLRNFEPADAHRFGTVGAVAVDAKGNVAAATSTGGMTAKRPGRIGDSPIIGAGTYASNQSCAVSATGSGEYFIRLTVAREICALVQYQHMKLQAAVDEVIQHRLTALGGDGGVIAAAPDGTLAWGFNTTGMYRIRVKQGGTPEFGIFKDEGAAKAHPKNEP